MEKLTKREREEIKKLEKIEAEKQISKNNLIKNILIWGGVIIVVGLSILGLNKLANSNTSVLAAQTTNIPAVSATDNTYGNKQAKVVIVEYSDFECPACANAQSFVKPALAEYKDRVLFVYRYFPLTQIHKTSLLSAQAAYAAGKQNKFWEMHNKLFENQVEWADKENAKDIFLSYAKTLNLDTDKFNQDLGSEEGKKLIMDQENAGINIGVNHTPTFYINNKEILKIPRNYEEFKQIIEGELK